MNFSSYTYEIRLKEWLLTSVAWLLISSLSFGQLSLADSLANELRNTSNDTTKVNLLNDLAWELKVSEPEQARQMLDSSIALAQKLKFRKGEAQAFNNKGVLEIIQGRTATAKGFMQQALAIRQDLGDQKGVASLYNNIGNLEDELGNFEGAIENLQHSLRICELLNDTLRIARTSYNIALVYESRGFYPEALDHAFKHLSLSQMLGDPYEIANAENLIGNIKSELEQFEEAAEHYERALQIRKGLDDELALANVLNNIGNNKDDFGEQHLNAERFPEAYEQFQQALSFYQESLAIYLKHEDQYGEAGIYNNIGLVYKNLGSYFKDVENDKEAKTTFLLAMDYLNRSLAIRTELDDERGIMEIYNGIGDVYRRQDNVEKALEYAERYLAIAEDLNDGKFIQNAYKDISRAYDDMGKYKKAFKFRKKYDELRYERLSEETARQNQRKEVIYGDIRKQWALDRQQNELALKEANLQTANVQRKALFGGVIGLLILALLLYNRYRIKHKSNVSLAEKNQLIENERQRAEALLHNILPKETAAELKATGKAKAKRYESATVMFTDFEAFTLLADQMSAEELVSELDECFCAFDDIIGKYGLEKIKTIGDAYMCAGGLPAPDQNHPANAINAAIEIQEFLKKYQASRHAQKRPAFKSRIGIHTGPVVAGIVGSKKFAYDIWGETVNLAARMESNGEAGRINISRTTYELVKNKFKCSFRGKINVKNMGEVEMFFVEKNTSVNLQHTNGEVIFSGKDKTT